MSAHAASPTSDHTKISSPPAWTIAAGFKCSYAAVAHEALQAVVSNKKHPLAEPMLTAITECTPPPREVQS
jgi:hypothetical protein